MNSNWKRLTQSEVTEYLSAESSKESLPDGLAGLLHRHSGAIRCSWWLPWTT